MVLDRLGTSPSITFDERLHDFGSGERLLASIKEYGGKMPTPMVVGHNPAIERLALMLAVGMAMPSCSPPWSASSTAALAVIDFDAKAWSSIKPGKGR